MPPYLTGTQVLKALAEGKELQVQLTYNEKWHDVSLEGALRHLLANVACENNNNKFRIKQEPEFIQINGFDVPRPLRVTPDYGTKVYFVGFHHADFYSEESWTGCSGDVYRFEAGFCHATAEAAYQHAEAVRSFTKKK